ncbi:MAG: hypothetical protein JEY99_00390 [Spirochaetales bacterium]|nr:hypothetical protein [Spirochaetales bacterium]
MAELSYEYEHFYSKTGFNNAATHFDTVVEVLGDFSEKINLADRINLLLNEKEIVQDQVPALVNALLVDKFEYTSLSYNLENNFEPSPEILKELISWKAVDMVMVYHHPDLGYMVLNPKNSKHWEQVTLFKSNELLTFYTGGFEKTKKGDKIYTFAMGKLKDLFKNRKLGKTDTLKKGPFKFIQIEEEPVIKAPVKAAPKRKATTKKSTTASEQQNTAAAPAVVEKKVEASVAPPSANRRMTPFYSVPVTNELFHNGNVEAWKKVIQSYQTKHTGLDVFIYYDGERIHDIHTLFKWGKVKHGSTILFAVAGEDIKDVAKLQRYLKQGASPRFEDFLKFPVNTVLNLF